MVLEGLRLGVISSISVYPITYILAERLVYESLVAFPLSC